MGKMCGVSSSATLTSRYLTQQRTLFSTMYNSLWTERRTDKHLRPFTKNSPVNGVLGVKPTPIVDEELELPQE